MNLYAGIDLHSSNSYIGIINDKAEKIMSTRTANDKEKILMILRPYQKQIRGIAVESTYNWYWLVDSLMENNYKVHLGNPAAFQQYKGLKYVNDKHDAFWLAQMLSLGLLPEGYIYPKEERGLRDLLRRRSQLVRQRTSLKISMQQICINQTGSKLTNNFIEKMKREEIQDMFTEEEWQLNCESLFSTLTFIKKEIDTIEKYILKQLKGKSYYKSLTSVPGVGEILGLTITLETGSIERFKSAGNYASYCRCVPSAYWSNEKKKGQGNAKNGNKYLSWAYAEAASFSIRYCDVAKKYYQRKKAKTNIPKAYRAVANKLAKSSYHMMKNGTKYDAIKLFGS
jgi:transposase